MDHCPKCNHSLHGLPDRHVCPECGLEYDRHCLVLRCPVRRDAWTQLILAAGLLSMFVWVIPRHGYHQGDELLVIAVLLSLAGSWIKWARGTDASCVISITRSGVQFDHPRIRADAIPWRAIRSTRCGWLSGKFKLTSTDGRALIRCPVEWLGGRKYARQIARLINMRRASCPVD